jgi:hypothetical protein
VNLSCALAICPPVVVEQEWSRTTRSPLTGNSHDGRESVYAAPS